MILYSMNSAFNLLFESPVVLNFDKDDFIIRLLVITKRYDLIKIQGKLFV